MLRLVAMIQTSCIIWIECGRAEHLYWSCFDDSRVIFLLNQKIKISPKGIQIKILIAAGSDCNFNRATTSVRVPSKYLEFHHCTKIKRNTKKWKRFSVSLNRFELDDVSDLKIIGKWVLELLMSLRASQKYGVLQLSWVY